MKRCDDCEKNNIGDAAPACPRCRGRNLSLMSISASRLGNDITMIRERVVYDGQKVGRTVTVARNGVDFFDDRNIEEEWNEIKAPFTGAGTTSTPPDANGDVLTELLTVQAHRWTIDRPVKITGPLQLTDTSGRASAPPPLSSGKTNAGDDIEDLAEFNNGHLIALVLGGPDRAENIVPMVRWFNQSGAWRRMEQAVEALVTNPPPPPARQQGGLALGTPATLVSQLTATIEIEYSMAGDPRVPVGFYVRIGQNGVPLAHYLLINDAEPFDPSDLDEEKDFLKAHWSLQLHPFDTPLRRQAFLTTHAPLGQQLNPLTITDDEVHGLIDGLAGPIALPAPLGPGVPLPRPPYRALQWLYQQNDAARDAGLAEPFTSVAVEPNLAQQNFSTNQRQLVRRYNFWRNGGAFVSDAGNGGYVGEDPDLYVNMATNNGRSFPEVDHIVPKHQNGKNSYENARLVSFAHNHIYRDKTLRGARPLSYANYRDIGWPQQLRSLSDSNVMTIRLTANNPYYNFSTQVKDRRGYLNEQAACSTRRAQERKRSRGYVLVATVHAAGVAAFRLVLTDNERQRLQQAFGNLPLG